MQAISQLLPARERIETPWLNGGGTTREVAREPGDPARADFDWRISIADVAASGPFSTFDGVDRTIVLIEGSGMRLDIDGVEQELRPLRPVQFAGESSTYCEISAGPTRDLNVMTRRGRVGAVVDVTELSAGVPVAVGGADPLVLFAVEGEMTVTSRRGPEAVLGPWDGFRWTSSEPLTIVGPGLALAVRFTTTAGSAR